MKRTRLILLLMLCACSLAPSRRAITAPRGSVAGGGGGGGATWSDTFDGTGALNGNWTVVSGAASRASDVCAGFTGGFAHNIIAYTGTSVGISQGVKFTFNFTGSTDNFPMVLFRYTDASSPCYFVQVEEDGTVTWYRRSTPTGSDTTVGTGSVGALTSGQTIAMTIDGTGNSTVIRIWKNISGDAVSVTDWNGDTTPDASLTDNPASAVNTGNFAGLEMQYSGANAPTIDNAQGYDL